MSPNPFDRSTFWGMTVGAYFSHVSSVTIGQKFVQRLVAINKAAEIKK